MKAKDGWNLRSAARAFAEVLVISSLSYLAVAILLLVMTGRPVNEFAAPTGLSGLGLGFCLRWVLDQHLDLDWLRNLGLNRTAFLMRLFFAGFFILGTAMYLSFGSRAGWNGLRVLTLAGYSWVSLVQTYFTLKQWLGCHKS